MSEPVARAKTNITKKVVESIRILCAEGYSDTSELAWLEGLKTGVISKETIYSAMTAYGFKWDVIRQTWYTRAKRMPFVKTLFTTVRKIDTRMMKKQGLI
jgi:hypothetical protein